MASRRNAEFNRSWPPAVREHTDLLESFCADNEEDASHIEGK
jgi:hypothetical protein